MLDKDSNTGCKAAPLASCGPVQEGGIPQPFPWVPICSQWKAGEPLKKSATASENLNLEYFSRALGGGFFHQLMAAHQAESDLAHSSAVVMLQNLRLDPNPSEHNVILFL